MDASTTCLLCAADVFHCHEVSVLHTDGATDCGDPWCTLPHHLHEWQAPCDAAVAVACSCAGGRADAAAHRLPVQYGGRRYTDTWLSLAS